MAGAGKTKRTPKARSLSAGDWAPRFLAALRDAANIRGACERSKVARSNVYKRRDSDPEFAEALKEALEESVDALEVEARRRAINGSDTMMIFLLKAARPKYRDSFKHEHGGANGGAIPLAINWHDMARRADEPDPAEAAIAEAEARAEARAEAGRRERREGEAP